MSDSEQSNELTETFSYDPTQAYLEMARAFLNVPVLAPKGASAKDGTMTSNTALALLANGYVFSFMAITAFVSGCLWKVWELPGSPLKSKYPKATNFTRLLKLGDWTDWITELCTQLNLRPLHTAEPKLWNQLVQVVKVTRDFLTHPKPDSDEFNRIVGDAMMKHSWASPSRTAQQVIQYFYVDQDQKPPEWLKENEEFRIEAIRALSVHHRPEV